MLQSNENKPTSVTLQLQLAQRHAQQWKTILQSEIHTRHAIATRHRQEVTDLTGQSNNPLERSKLLLRHINELTQLKCSNHLKRQLLRKEQEQEQAYLIETALLIPCE